MATILLKICDTCSEEDQVPGTAVTVGIDGRVYEADMCAPDKTDFKNRLAPFLAMLRPVAKTTSRSHKTKAIKAPPPTAAGRTGSKLRLDPFECGKCHGIFYGAQGLGAHTRSCDGTPAPGEFRCEDCRRNFESEMRYVEHRFEIHQHQVEGYLNCPQCGRPYRFQDPLDRHIAREHPLEGAHA